MSGTLDCISRAPVAPVISIKQVFNIAQADYFDFYYSEVKLKNNYIKKTIHQGSTISNICSVFKKIVFRSETDFRREDDSQKALIKLKDILYRSNRTTSLKIDFSSYFSGKNHISMFCKSLSRLMNLLFLEIDFIILSKFLKDKYFDIVTSGIKNQKQLRVLKLLRISSVSKEGIKSLSKLLHDSHSLHTLSLSFLNQDDLLNKDFHVLFDGLKECINLSLLSLDMSYITEIPNREDTVINIALALQNLSKLESFNFKCNLAQSSQGIIRIIQALSELKSLKELYWNSHIIVNDTLATNLAKTLESLALSLEKFYISICSFQSGNTCTQFDESLAKMNKLKSLSLFFDNDYESNMKKAFSGLKCLENLSLVIDETFYSKEILGSIYQLEYLKTFKLSVEENCNSKEAIFTSLSSSLKRMSSLNELDLKLEFYEFDDMSILEVMKGLEDSKNLEKFSLTMTSYRPTNPIQKSILKFSACSKKLSKLKYLNFSFNNITLGKDEVKIYTFNLEKLQSLEEIVFSVEECNGMTEENLKRLLKKMSNLPKLERITLKVHNNIVPLEKNYFFVDAVFKSKPNLKMGDFSLGRNFREDQKYLKVYNKYSLREMKKNFDDDNYY